MLLSLSHRMAVASPLFDLPVPFSWTNCMFFASPGGEPRQLTFDHHRIFGAPIWSRGSAQILFASNRAGMKSLWQVSANGGASQPVLGPGPVADHRQEHSPALPAVS